MRTDASIVSERPRVTALRSEEDLARMEPEWNTLLAKSASDTAFLTWEWIASWWSAYRRGRNLELLRVDGADGLIGVLPLYEDGRPLLGPLRYRVLALVGDGSADSDYLDGITRKGSEDDVADAVLAELRARGRAWDLLLLNDVPSASPQLAALQRAAGRAGWYWNATRVPCARVDLPGSWDEYLRVLKPRMRTKVRSTVRDLERQFRIEYERCTDPSDLDDRLRSLYDLHNRRWDSAGKRGVFHSEEKRAFYASMAHRFLTSGRLRFDSLRADGRYVAHQFCFEHGGRMFLLQEGLDPEWFSHGAGNALRAHVFRDCIERGLNAYDFLGGVTPHKLSWGATVHYSVRVTAGPKSWKNSLLFLTRDARAIAKRLLKPEAQQEEGP